MTDPYASLGRELVRAARRLEGAGGAEARIRAWVARHLRAIAASAALLLSGGAVAIAATGVLSGSPVAPESRPVGSAGNGVPVGAAQQGLGAEANDPSGGLRWGARVLHTTRGQVCIQVGRVQGGQLGEIGEDSVFGDDGLFHALPADALPPGQGGAGAEVDCVAEGRTLLFEDANADRNAARLLPEEFEPPGRRRLPPMSHRRALAYGLLGPHVVSITYRTPGGPRTIPVHGRDGAFLIVQPAGLYRSSSLVGGSFEGRAEPRSVFVLGSGSPLGPPIVSAATFRFGAELCSEGSGAPVANRCPERPVFQPQRWFDPTRSLNRHVDLRLVPQTDRACKRAFLSTPCYRALVAFIAPYSIHRAGADYSIQGRARCPVGGRPETGWSLERDVARGEHIRTLSLGLFDYVPSCAADESFTVTYLNPRGPSRAAPHESVIVGRVALREAAPRK